MKTTSSSSGAFDATGNGSKPRAHGRRLVLADDDQDLRETLALAMRREGYDVVELEDGWQLLVYLATHMLHDGERSSVDLVISDVRMPGKSGLDVLAGVQWGRHPPAFILITAFADAQTRAEAWRLGATALVTKPFTLDEMRTLVQDIGSRRVAKAPEA